MTQGRNVDVCPVTKKVWEERAKAKHGDCGGQSEYHCLADNEGRKWERCVEKTLVKGGYCPIFTNKGFIDWKPCNSSIPTCPSSAYFSNDVYKYSHCFGNNSLHEQSLDHSKDDGISLAAGLCGLFILIAVITFGFMYIHRRKRTLMNSYKQDELKDFEKLLPEQISDEIVKGHNVVNGIDMLSKDKVRSIVVVGKFGNSFSSTSRRISKKFQDRMKWNSLECRYTDIPNTVEENTVLYVYGWFGLWNDDLCSVAKAKTACKSLIQILNETTNVKVIIGMRSDLYRKYHEELDKEVDGHKTSLVNYEINLDSGGDILKDDEYSKLLNSQIKKPCEKNKCACKHLEYKMLRKGDDKVLGMPLKIRIIEKYHNLIPNYLHHWDMLKVMIDHLTAIEKDRERRRVYEWIVYICLKGTFTPGSFDANLVEEIGFIIDELSFEVTFDDNDSELCRYIRMRNSDKQKNVASRNAQYVFWHPFIYICAFHFLFHRDPDFVIKHCNVDAILQLVRPRGFKTSYFEVTANDQQVVLAYERICLLNKGEYVNHPLVNLGRRIIEVETMSRGLKMIFSLIMNPRELGEQETCTSI